MLGFVKDRRSNMNWTFVLGYYPQVKNGCHKNITIDAPCNGMSVALMLAMITMEEGCMPP